jgi:hypothetical protein
MALKFKKKAINLKMAHKLQLISAIDLSRKIY